MHVLTSRLSPITLRRLAAFKANRRARISLWLFGILFIISLFAELIANDKPIVMQYDGQWYVPLLVDYPETEFGGFLPTRADYLDPFIQQQISDHGWALWPIIPYSYDTPVERSGAAPLPPNGQNLLGTDGTKRDVLARVIHGFRLSIIFTLIVTGAASLIGIIAGAVQGFFGGWTDLIFQRVIEIWTSTPSLYVIIIMFAILGRSFWLLVFLLVLFSWTSLVGVVRAEFLRARNLEYVRAARALGVGNMTIMFRHMLPNAMVAMLTMLPFIITGTISTLAILDFLGFGLPSSAPSLGELTLQAKQNLQAPWLAFTAFFTFAIMLSLLIFIFEGIRDAFDPRKTFS